MNEDTNPEKGDAAPSEVEKLNKIIEGLRKQKKKKHVKLTSKNALVLQHEVQINLVKHVLAAKHFECRQYWWFSMPQAVLTAVASILAFYGSSLTGSSTDGEEFEFGETDINLTASTDINLAVGSISAIVVLFQTVSGFKMFDKRADRHANTAIQLRDLRDQLKILVVKLKSLEFQEKQRKERKNSNKSTPDDESDQLDEDEEEADLADSFDLIQKKFQQALAGCTSYVPLQLGECFHGLSSNLELRMTMDNKKEMKKRYGEDFDEIVLTGKAIDILASNILKYRWFPWDIPDPKGMIEDTMKEFEDRLDEMAEPLKTIGTTRGESDNDGLAPTATKDPEAQEE